MLPFPNTPKPATNSQVISYYALRLLIGITGMALPLLLVLAKAMTGQGWQLETSISAYYGDGAAGDILVGLLFAQGFFLFCYRGYEKIDSIVGNFACLCCLGVALFPTTSTKEWVVNLHFAFGFLMFASFIYFSIFLFRKTDPFDGATKKKMQRNKVYLVCGLVMLACIIGIGIGQLLLAKATREQYHLTFWLESLALWAFGFSWIVKAEWLFWKDSHWEHMLNHSSELRDSFFEMSDRMLSASPAMASEREVYYEMELKEEKVVSIGDFTARTKAASQGPPPKKDPGGELELFYGTTRKQTGSTEANDYYGSELGALQLGSCTISIPSGHKQGEIERPRKILFWQLKENTDNHIVLTSVKELDGAAFYNWLSGNVTGSNKSALLFIHGFNTSFAEAAWRAGQIVYDIPFNNGIAGFFSWPSTGGSADYAKDIERADASVSDLVQFMEDLVGRTGIEQLNLIAHSMGNRVLTRALNILVQKDSFKGKLKVINQIVLAAPDIDAEVFNREILPAFKQIGNRRTLYASDKDKALKLSKFLRRGLPRIGEAGTNIYVADGLDTVDASNVDSEGNHHSYMFETVELLTDLNMLMAQGLDPGNRRLRQVDKQGLRYWLFRE